MAQDHHPHTLHEADQTPLGDKAGPAYRLLFTVGAAAVLLAVLAVPFSDGGVRRFGFAYVLAFAFVLSLGLGSLFFVVVTHLFRAGWAVVIRRPAETFAANLSLLAVMFVPILLLVWANNGLVYPWAQPNDQLKAKYYEANYGGHSDAADPGAVHILPVAAEGDDAHHSGGEHGDAHAASSGVHVPPYDLVEKKKAYLNIGFFTVRWILYFVIWSILGYVYWRTSISQDVSGDHTLTNRLQGLAPAGILLFALTLTFASLDLLMSLDPAWFSTMWGVYFFSGSVVSTVAALILILMILQHYGLMQAVNVEHYHDLGKLLFAFVFFWGYIAFSQYMLIWYAAIPEETGWFELHGVTTAPAEMTGWTVVAIVLLVGHLLIPFAGLLSRHVKRRKWSLGFWAVWMIVMHVIDLWWIVMPSFNYQQVTFGVVEAGLLIGLTSIFLGAAVYRAASYPLVPQKDPRLQESLAFENL